MLASKNTILPSLETATNVTLLAAQYPWYPTAQLWLAQQQPEAIGRLAAFVQHPLRMHVLLSPDVATASPEPATAPPPADVPTLIEETVLPQEPSVESIPTTTDIEQAADAPITTGDTPPVEEAPLPQLNITLTEPAEDEDLLLQPYHTVDYFAALGIKIDAAQLGTTRFDTQLKSFTQWLKTMKRINYQTGEMNSDPLVEQQAKASILAKEIVTEAMADVLARQGMRQQAIAVYQKLSLLHPEKSVFFAAQIEKLKAEK